MGIVVRLDVMLALRKMRSKDLAAKIDITEAKRHEQRLHRTTRRGARCPSNWQGECA